MAGLSRDALPVNNRKNTGGSGFVRPPPLPLGRTVNAAHLGKRDEPLLQFIPQYKADASQALDQCQATHVLQLGEIAHNLGQTVKWNPARKVVNVVDADIGREPAQDPREVVV